MRRKNKEMDKLTPKKPWYEKPGCLVGIALAVILLVIGAVNAIASGGNGVGNTGGSTPTTQTTQTSQPTPTPTPRPKPLSPEQRAVQLATNQTLFGKNVTASFSGAALDITEYIDTNGFFNNGSILTAIKNDCFNVLQAEYKNTTGLSAVDLKITAPLQDQYGNPFTGKLAECTLNSDTETQFNWGNLLPDTAWGDYDYTYTLPSLGS